LRRARSSRFGALACSHLRKLDVRRFSISSQASLTEISPNWGGCPCAATLGLALDRDELPAGQVADLQRKLIEVDVGVRAQRLPLGVDLRKWPPLAPRPRREGPAHLIHIASLNRVKDQSTLLHALARLEKTGVDFVMDIVGTDTLHGATTELARKLGLNGRVRFLGFRTQRELRPIVESADLLVMSSRHEAGPFVLVEAAVTGVPTVGTAVGHIVEWAPSAALAVPVANPERLADAIHTMLADEALRLRVARAAQCRALSEDADYTARTFEALYQRLANGSCG